MPTNPNAINLKPAHVSERSKGRGQIDDAPTAAEIKAANKAAVEKRKADKEKVKKIKEEKAKKKDNG